MIKRSYKAILFYLFNLIFALTFTSSCTKHIEQYSPNIQSEENLTNLNQELGLTEQINSSRFSNNIRVSKSNTAEDSEEELPPQELYIAIKQTATLPIDYETSSIAGIDIHYNLKELNSILNLFSMSSYEILKNQVNLDTENQDNLEVENETPFTFESETDFNIKGNINTKTENYIFALYKEGLLIRFKEKKPERETAEIKEIKETNEIKETEKIESTLLENFEVKSIVALKSYKGMLDFGPGIGKRQIGDSFSNQFNLNQSNIQKDLDAKNFIKNIYNHFEKTNEDCFKLNQCFISFVNELSFNVDLPKMILNFGTDKRKTLISITLKGETEIKEFTASKINYQNRTIDDEETTKVVLDVDQYSFLDFGPKIGPRKKGDSFSDIMDLTLLQPEKSENVQNFIISLYNHLEGTNINCLQEEKCDIKTNNEKIPLKNKQLIFKLPKIWLFFEKNKLSQLNKILIIPETFEKNIENLKHPFNYSQNFIGNIDINMSKAEIKQNFHHILQFINEKAEIEKKEKAYNTIDTIDVFEGRMILSWNEDDSIRTIEVLSEEKIKEITYGLDTKIHYDRSFDFGPEVGQRKLGSSFADVFNLDQNNPKEDSKAKDFIVSTYNLWENSDENCLETGRCTIIATEKDIQFVLPKVNLSFSNDFQRNFLQIMLKGSKIQEAKEKLLKNITLPIDPINMSIANINIYMSREEIEKIIHLHEKIENVQGPAYYYREGLLISWANNNYPEWISVRLNPEITYKGKFDFGDKIGLKSLGDSFSDQLSTSIYNSNKHSKAKDFIVSIYNFLNNDSTNCLEAKLCRITIFAEDSEIVFTLPFLTLVFENNTEKTFLSVILEKTNHFNDNYFLTVSSN